jgi:hypothetical protein
LADHGEAVKSDRRADAGNDRVHMPHPLTLVEQFRLAMADAEVEPERIENADFVPAFFAGLDDRAGAV